MANPARRSTFMSYQNLATAEQRWPSLRTNADFLAIWHELFNHFDFDRAHDIFEGFDGGWSRVSHRLRRLYKTITIRKGL